VLPYPGTPNPSPSSQGFSSAFDELTSVSSHEIAEAVTDPDVNYKRLGWYDDQLNGEIGDLTDQNSRLGGYLIQDLVGKNDQVIVPAPDNGGGGGGSGGGGTTTLATPSIVSATAASTTSVSLTWSTVSGATGYRILVTQNGQTSVATTVAAGTSTTQSATVNGLTAGSTASFKVEAFNATQTADSTAVSLTLPAPSGSTTLAAPQVTAVAISTTRVKLSWNPVTGAEGYRIYWWNGVRAVLLGRVSASAASVQITRLTPGSTNQFFVEAYGGGQVADSAWVSITMPARSFAGRHSNRMWLS
jgi:hypothetical protein